MNVLRFITTGWTIILVELAVIIAQSGQDFVKLNNRREKRDVDWKIHAAELVPKFRELLKPASGLSETMNIEPYSGSILDYPKPDEFKKLKIFELMWEEYYECLKSQYDSMGRDKVFHPQARMVFEGSNMRLTCDLCMSPEDIRESVRWYYSPNMDHSQAAEIDEDSNIIISRYDYTLHVLSVRKSNSGLYQCHIKNTQSTVYFVHVVDTEPVTLVRPPTAAKNHSLQPVENKAYGITVWSDWTEWSKCSRCGKVGKKLRTGYCTVTLSENLEIVGDGQDTTEQSETPPSVLPVGGKNVTDAQGRPENVTDTGQPEATEEVTATEQPEEIKNDTSTELSENVTGTDQSENVTDTSQPEATEEVTATEQPEEINNVTETEQPEDVKNDTSTELSENDTSTEQSENVTEAEQPEATEKVTETEQPEETRNVTETEQPEKIKNDTSTELSENVTSTEQSENVTEAEQPEATEKVIETEQPEETKNVTETERPQEIKNDTSTELSENVTGPERPENVTGTEQPEATEEVTETDRPDETKNVTETEQPEEIKTDTGTEQSENVTEAERPEETEDVTETGHSEETKNVTETDQPEAINDITATERPEEKKITITERPEMVTETEQPENVTETERQEETMSVTETEQPQETISVTETEQPKEAENVTETGRPEATNEVPKNVQPDETRNATDADLLEETKNATKAERPENVTDAQWREPLFEDRKLESNLGYDFDSIDFKGVLEKVFGEEETNQRHFSGRLRKKKHKKRAQLKTKINFKRQLEDVFHTEKEIPQDFALSKTVKKVLFGNRGTRDNFVGVDYELAKTWSKLEKVFDEEQGSKNFYYKKLMSSNVANNRRVRNNNKKKRRHKSDFYWLWTRPVQRNPEINKDLAILRLFDGGLPCRSQLLPDQIRNLPEVSSRTTEVMLAYCKEPCVESVLFQVYNTEGKIIEEVNNTAGLYSTLQDLPDVPPTVVRQTVTVKANFQDLKLVCPGSIHEGVPVEWQLRSTPLISTNIQRRTNGRVIIDLFDRIVFTSLNKSDENMYSCWQNKELVGVVTLVIDQSLPYEVNRQFLILGVLPIVVTFGICLYRVFKLRHWGFS